MGTLRAHDPTVYTRGSTNVQALVEVLADDPQYRFESSHRTTPPQLSVKTLPLMSNLVPYGPGTRESLPESAM